MFNLSCRTPRKLNFKILNFKKEQTRKSNQGKKWEKERNRANGKERDSIR